ncbi:MAG TPA: phosphoribosyltransferase family protein [Mycobacteriales bacterium]|nr:phosphoribosyltransferase family protein [Mycobacteriales bacterium]
MRFRDRAAAGRRLAALVVDRGLADPVVLALPRGGVPVAFEVAAALGVPFNVFVARKVGCPGRPELGIGAVAEGGGVVARADALDSLGISRRDFDRLAEAEREEVDRRVRRYRGTRALPPVAGRDVVLVDDGIATGGTAEAALLALRARHPRALVLAAPTCAPESAAHLRAIADVVLCVVEPDDFRAVGAWYDRFDQTSDAEVRDLLERSAVRP